MTGFRVLTLISPTNTPKALAYSFSGGQKSIFPEANQLLAASPSRKWVKASRCPLLFDIFRIAILADQLNDAIPFPAVFVVDLLVAQPVSSTTGAAQARGYARP